MRDYIEDIKVLIANEIAGDVVTKNYVDSLFEKINPNIVLLAQIKKYPVVDAGTLANYFDIAKKEYLSVHPIDPGISHSLTKEGYKTWLDEQRLAEMTGKWHYTERYFSYLRKQGRSEKVINEVRKSSLDIAKKMADPKSSVEVYKKGLVVGAVQSGKTGNFNAVINRAVDSGYSLIIVLSGIMEDLRSQTQKRIETDVVGEGRNEDTNTPGNRKGVGEIERFGPLGGSEIRQVACITSVRSDFNRNLLDADFSLNNTNVLVCKKNVSVLRNLIVWLHDCLEQNQEQHNISLLILDDEADNASLNNSGVKGREYASKINGHIRALLQLFRIKTYLGYTATPFANVLQDRNEVPENDWIVKYRVKGQAEEKQLRQVGNIFPDDFIVLLDPPSNYIGAKQIFETINPIENATEDNSKIPLIADPIHDHIVEFPSRVYLNEDGNLTGVENFENKDMWEEKNGQFGSYLHFQNYDEYKRDTRSSLKDDGFPRHLPASLKEAVNCFLLALAIRESRMPKMIHSILFNPHNTMLIHVSRFTFWQNRTKDLVNRYVEDSIARLNTENPTHQESIYKELEKVWYKNYASIVENIKMYLPPGYEDEFLTPIVFESLKTFLPAAVKGVEVKAINSLTKDSLEYPKNNPKKYIAIGGNRLSRGFTLEGLSINYFIRATNYSDTLLQMGRWFGYRPGYIDCCKIFTTKDALDKFNSTTRCIEELEEEFIKMESRGKDPQSFVLRVRTHPGTLKITRPSILKNATEVKWSYQDQNEMTTRFNIQKDHIEKTWDDFRMHIAPRFDSMKDNLLQYETNSEEILRILKQTSTNFDKDTVNQMSRFIELCQKRKLISNWTVALKISGNTKTYLTGDDVNLAISTPDIELARRSGPNNLGDYKSDFLKDKIFKASGKNANIISSNEDLAIILSPDKKALAVEQFRLQKVTELMEKDDTLSEEKATELALKKTIADKYYREQMSEDQGLLVVYLFDSNYVFNQKGKDANQDRELIAEFRDFVEENSIDLSIPLVGHVIVFPPMKNGPGGIYMKGDYELDIDEQSEENEELFEMVSDSEQE